MNYLRGSFHQGSANFDEVSRVRQCGFMAFVSLLESTTSTQVRTSTAQNSDHCLVEADCMLRHALYSQKIRHGKFAH